MDYHMRFFIIHEAKWTITWDFLSLYDIAYRIGQSQGKNPLLLFFFIKLYVCL
jgi:hypothetical protein